MKKILSTEHSYRRIYKSAPAALGKPHPSKVHRSLALDISETKAAEDYREISKTPELWTNFLLLTAANSVQNAVIWSFISTVLELKIFSFVIPEAEAA